MSVLLEPHLTTPSVNYLIHGVFHCTFVLYRPNSCSCWLCLFHKLCSSSGYLWNSITFYSSWINHKYDICSWLITTELLVITLLILVNWMILRLNNYVISGEHVRAMYYVISSRVVFWCNSKNLRTPSYRVKQKFIESEIVHFLSSRKIVVTSKQTR